MSQNVYIGPFCLIVAEYVSVYSFLSLISLALQVRQESTDCGLKDILAEIIPEKQKEVKEFRSQHGNFVVGEVNIDMVSVKHLFAAVMDFDLPCLSVLSPLIGMYCACAKRSVVWTLLSLRDKIMLNVLSCIGKLLSL